MSPTIRDVARRANVGLGTVSRVLNDSPQVSETTRARVLDAAEALGFHPNISARRLVTGETRQIAYIERQSPAHVFSDSFWPQVLRGIHDAAQESGHEVLFAPDNKVQGQGRAGRLLRRNHVDGVIISGPRKDDAEVLSLIEEDAPLVVQGAWPDPHVPSVDVDNHAAAYQATDHLIGLGHRRIAIIIHSPAAYTSSMERYGGYRQALIDHGIPEDPALVGRARFTPASGERAMEALLKLDPMPTALFATSDTVAIGAMAAIRRHGLSVPGDFAVVGFDDVPIARYLDPPLTTIRLPAYELGKHSARLLVSRLAGEPLESPRHVLRSELIVRHSCGQQAHGSKLTSKPHSNSKGGDARQF
ncbi:MAG: LacI family DNA-binding transcriptional regulator [Anaerolineales bacterium]|jgi:LacI family transcriptional regulator